MPAEEHAALIQEALRYRIKSAKQTEREQRCAAVRLQSVARMGLCRRLVRRRFAAGHLITERCRAFLVLRRRRVTAATELQRLLRGCRDRRRLNLERACAVRLQALGRGRHCRERYKVQRQGAVLVQAILRQRVASSTL